MWVFNSLISHNYGGLVKYLHNLTEILFFLNKFLFAFWKSSYKGMAVSTLRKNSWYLYLYLYLIAHWISFAYLTYITVINVSNLWNVLLLTILSFLLQRRALYREVDSLKNQLKKVEESKKHVYEEVLYVSSCNH